MAAKHAELSYHVHATEDEGRLDGALQRLLGVGATVTETLFGHNGNVILVRKGNVSDGEAERLLTGLLSGLEADDRARLRGDLATHMDGKGAFFVRLDKQGLILGRMALADTDAIWFRFKLDADAEGAEEEIGRRLS